MSVFKNKNDYSVTVFRGSKQLIKMPFVHDIVYFEKWYMDNVAAQRGDWSLINVYTRRDNKFLRRFYKKDVLIGKPK